MGRSPLAGAMEMFREDCRAKRDGSKAYIQDMMAKVLNPLKQLRSDHKKRTAFLEAEHKSVQSLLHSKLALMDEAKLTHFTYVAKYDEAMASYEKTREDKESEEENIKLRQTITQLLALCKDSEKTYKMSVFDSKNALIDNNKALVRLPFFLKRRQACSTDSKPSKQSESTGFNGL
jgi:hypothetical protein